jgi:hypothetical protein
VELPVASTQNRTWTPAPAAGTLSVPVLSVQLHPLVWPCPVVPEFPLTAQPRLRPPVPPATVLQVVVKVGVAALDSIEKHAWYVKFLPVTALETPFCCIFSLSTVPWPTATALSGADVAFTV